MPASGKTTIGRMLSGKMNYNFIDTDKVIEINENMTVEEIFKYKGEEYFRNLEGKMADNIMFMDNMIIATGGGLPTCFHNMDKLNKAGITVFLNVPIKELIKRNEQSHGRPLLQNNMKEKIIDLYRKRFFVYNKAHIKVNNYNKSIDIVCNSILKAIIEYENNNKIK